MFKVIAKYTDGKQMEFKFNLWSEVTAFLSRLELRNDLVNWIVESSNFHELD